MSDMCSGGDCVTVEPRPAGGVILSTTRQRSYMAVIDGDEWAAFLADVKAGRYDGAPTVPAVPAAELERLRAAHALLTLASTSGATVVRIDDMRAVLSGQRRTAGRH